MTATDLAEFLRNALDASDRACTNPEAGTAYAHAYLCSAVRQAIHTLNNRAQVEQAEAERAANELVGPPVDSPVSRTYRSPTVRELLDAIADVNSRVRHGVSLGAACEDAAFAIGLSPDELRDEVNLHNDGDRAIAAEETR